MTHVTTISLNARVDMQDEMQNFVSHKSLPTVRVRLGDHVSEHKFSHTGEQHKFTVTARLARGEHDLVLEFAEKGGPQGAIEIVSLRVHGYPIGMAIYQCRYTPYETGETLRSHLYLGWPGEWRLALQVPVQESRLQVGIQ